MARNIRAKRSLGQNFLVNLWPVRLMAKEANVAAGDTVLEIGPGKGILTKELLFCGAHVIAVEKDDVLFIKLQDKFREEIESEKLELIHGDIMDFDVGLHFAHTPYKLIANIPYNITGLLMRHFLEHTHQPISITFLVQKEVADRICMRDKKSSILALSVAVFGTARYVEKVGRTLFRPAPNVDSAIIHISHIHNPFANTEAKNSFFTTIKTAFNSKRKKVSTTLKGYTIPENVRDKRPEELSVVDFLKITI